MQPCFCVLGGAWPGTQQIARSDRQAVIGCFGNEAENRKDKGATWMTVVSYGWLGSTGSQWMSCFLNWRKEDP